eukprot:SAG11_NODE_722_length_7532_cov_6.943630_4_plen_122_part_00
MWTAFFPPLVHFTAVRPTARAQLVVLQVMDAHWLAEVNAIVDKYQHTVTYPDAAGSQVLGTPQMQGTARPGLDVMATITSDADRAPFARMLAHPALVQRLKCAGFLDVARSHANVPLLTSY